MPPSFSEPESFIHHALMEQKAPSQAAPWLAPIVISSDGRMAKWCGRYGKLGVEEVRALGDGTMACADAMLAPAGRWVTVAAQHVAWRELSGSGSAAPAATELRRDVCRTNRGSGGGGESAGATPRGPARLTAAAAAAHAAGAAHPKRLTSAPTTATARSPGALCTWANGCCKRHPRLSVCRAAPGGNREA